MNKRIICVFIVLAMFLSVSSVSIAKEEPSATLTMKLETIALGLGSISGEGVLTYQGKDYNFSISGLTTLDIGGSETVATGEVYGMHNLIDFEGKYSMAGAGATIFAGGENAVYHKQDGVYIEMRGKTTGFRATAAVGGITLTLAK